MLGVTEAVGSFPAQTAMVPRFVLLAFDPNPGLCGDCRHSIHTIVSCSSNFKMDGICRYCMC